MALTLRGTTRSRPSSADQVRCASAFARLLSQRAARVGGSRPLCTRARAAPAPSRALTAPVTIRQERSPTKLARIGAPALGRGGSLAYPKIPRPKGWGTEFSTSAPRTAVGINEYLYALSQRGHGAVRCVEPC